MKLIIALLVSSSILLSCSGPGTDFRTRMEALDWGSDTCYVTGHKAPDVDAVCSAIAYADLMQSLGYSCSARVCGPVNNETAFVSKTLGFKLPPVLEAVEPGARIILTDHSEYAQSVTGARQARILQLIDHHIPGDIDTCSIPFVRVSPVGSACTLVWELYGEAGLEPSEQSAKALLAGVMSDTKNLNKKGTTKRDSLAWTALSRQLGMSPEQVFIISLGMAEASRSYEGMSDEEIYLSDCKSYQYEGRSFRVGSVDWLDPATESAFLDRMLAAMESLCGADEFLFAKVDVATEGCYILYCGYGAEDVARRAFGQPKRKGVCYSPSPLNRKAHVVPMLQKAIAEGNVNS